MTTNIPKCPHTEENIELTEERRDRISKELWGDLAESGGLKEDWTEGWEKYGKMVSDCPYCEYQVSHQSDCENCPIWEKYSGCSRTYYRDWLWGATLENRKKFARLFLIQLEAL